MNSPTYFDTLCDVELENVAACMSMYPYPERWGRAVRFGDIRKYVDKGHPLRRACGSLLRRESTLTFPTSTLLAGADLLEHITLEPWNVEEFEDEQLIESFLNACTSLTSVRLRSFWPLHLKQVWSKRLMEAIGEQLTSISVSNEPLPRLEGAWVLRYIEAPCVNLRKLELSCAPAQALCSEFWQNVGPRLRELEIRFQWSYTAGYDLYVADVKQITQFVKEHCQGLSALNLEGEEICNQVLAECIASFPQLEVTKLSDFSAEQAKLIAASCPNVRVHLTLMYEPTAHEIIRCFRDKIDVLLVDNILGFVDDLEVRNTELEAALNDCRTIKKYSCNTLALLSYLCAKPKGELIEFTLDTPREQIQASHLVALTKSTGHLRKIHMDNITFMLPSALWKEFFTANCHLEHVGLSFCIKSNFDPDEHQDDSTNEQEFRLAQKSKHLAELLKLILPLQNLRFAKLLHRNCGTPTKNEIRNLKNACVLFRHRKIYVDVNGIVILPIGYDSIR